MCYSERPDPLDLLKCIIDFNIFGVELSGQWTGPGHRSWRDIADAENTREKETVRTGQTCNGGGRLESSRMKWSIESETQGRAGGVRRVRSFVRCENRGTRVMSSETSRFELRLLLRASSRSAICGRIAACCRLLLLLTSYNKRGRTNWSVSSLTTLKISYDFWDPHISVL